MESSVQFDAKKTKQLDGRLNNLRVQNHEKKFHECIDVLRVNS